jgi:hypothetical protein
MVEVATEKKTTQPAHAVGGRKEAVRVKPLESEEERDIQQTMKTNSRIFLGVYIVLIALGIGTGYVLSSKITGGGLKQKATIVKTDTVVGSTDTTTFKDSAEGVIEKGGSDGEGSHKLIREGGPSQTAYLVSSIIDLDEYAGKKVRIWGQTMAAKKVSWLMDVGKIETLSQ